MSHPTDKPYRLTSDSDQVPAVLALVQRSFAYMEGRIDPPSSMHRLTEESVRNHCEQEEVWAIGTPPLACVFLTKKEDCLYLGKLAVDEAARGRGYARILMDLAEARAQEMGYSVLELQVRVELTENQATFGHFGFVKTGEDAHEGYDRPTSFTLRKNLKPKN